MEGFIISYNKINVIIIDDSVEICKTIASHLEKEERFSIVDICTDGEAGLESVLTNDVDCVILDILLPKRDGISILEEINNNMSKKPIIIVLTAVGQEYTTKKVLELGASYVILKPFSVEILIKRMLEQIDTKEKNFGPEFFTFNAPKLTKEEHISTILQKSGIPVNLKGYNYLKVAIKLSIEQPELLESITKSLYPTVAKNVNTTSSRVERDIRHALEVAWSRSDGEFYYNYIGFKSIDNEKPTNGAFISSIVEKSRIYFINANIKESTTV